MSGSTFCPIWLSRRERQVECMAIRVSAAREGKSLEVKTGQRNAPYLLRISWQCSVSSCLRATSFLALGTREQTRDSSVEGMSA